MAKYCGGCMAPVQSHLAGGTKHHDWCPVANGAEWQCSCPGPYCDGAYCDGAWRLAGGAEYTAHLDHLAKVVDETQGRVYSLGEGPQ